MCGKGAWRKGNLGPGLGRGDSRVRFVIPFRPKHAGAAVNKTQRRSRSSCSTTNLTVVSPAKAGIQVQRAREANLGPGLRREDNKVRNATLASPTHHPH